MALSWTEIKDRALRFAHEWKDEASEDAEAKSFWDDFFTVFGVTRRRLAQFEKAVERPGRSKSFVDLSICSGRVRWWWSTNRGDGASMMPTNRRSITSLG